MGVLGFRHLGSTGSVLAAGHRHAGLAEGTAVRVVLAGLVAFNIIGILALVAMSLVR
jgi:hypothetical protein